MSKMPMERQIRYLYFIPQLLILVLYLLLFHLIGVKEPVLPAAITYLLVSISLRVSILFHYKRGFRHYKREEYQEAIEQFVKSNAFFNRFRWVDKYRYIILLSSSQLSYLEMSLVNMAFCYEQLGNNKKAKELYLHTLSLFSHSQIAKDALKLMSTMKKS